jgi:DNA transposition AAA+ family ATPase
MVLNSRYFAQFADSQLSTIHFQPSTNMAHTLSLPPTDRDDLPPAGSSSASSASSAVKSRCNEALREKLRALRASSPVYSNNQLAKKLGYSSAVLSQYLADDGCKYPSSVAPLEKKIEDYLQALERRRASGIETNPSKVADDMFTAFEYVRKTNDLGAVIGDSGAGKTRAIELILAKNELTILIEVTEWNRSVHDIMRAIWTGCAVDGWDSSCGPQFPYLVQKMRGSDRPFLFDDAHKLSRDALSLIATFQEKTGCPIALFGCSDLVAKLESDPQRLSRTGLHWSIKPDAVDSKLLLHMVQSIAKTVNGDLDDLLELCGQVAAHHGHFRAVHKQLKLAAEFRHANLDLSWPDAFRKAHTKLLRPYKLS